MATHGQIKLELIEKDVDPSKRIDALAPQKTRRGYQPKYPPAGQASLTFDGRTMPPVARPGEICGVSPKG
ncbi:hypothetical protein JJQ51_20775 [Rhizobium sp. AG207R]|nr:hypothetical protein [Rhizobium sp. AG207R]